MTVPTDSLTSQRLLKSTNQWITDGTVPVNLYSSVGSEIGGAFWLPNGKALFIGGGSTTALYTPTGNDNPGSWVQGPSIPNVRDVNGNFVPGGAPDAGAAMMVNGRILCAFSPQMYANPSPPPANIFPTPTSFAIYNPSTNSFSTIDGPTGATVNVPAYQNLMLVLPDGSVLYSNFGDQLYTYSPDIAPTPLAAGKPAITSITTNSDGSYHLTGTTLNGISEGASYGDDAQMDSNYPIVRLTAGSNQYYARTFNWSSTGIQTGSTPVSTEFTLPAAILDGGGGTYSLVVVANGISSDPVMFSSPVWVDFTNFIPFFQNGTQNFPYATLGQAVAAVPVGGSIFLKGPRSSSQTFTSPPISNAMTIIAIGGAATVGQ